MNTLLQDIRFGLRMLLKSPSMSIIATIALALGIGANTAIFSVVNAVLLRPLPFPNPDALVSLYESDTQFGYRWGAHSYPNFLDLRAQNTTLERVSSFYNSNFVMTGRGEPARLQGLVAPADLFPLLGVAPMMGRTFGISLLTGLIFGLTPAFHSSKTELVEPLKEGGRGTSEGARRNRVRSVLVVGELAVAVVLLVGAGLLIQSLWRLRNVNTGLQPRNILTFNVGLPEVKYKSAGQTQFFIDLKSRLESMPGVQSASTIYPLPLSGDRYSISFEIEGRPLPPTDHPSADFFTTGVGYFRAMGIPVIKGRDFDDRDKHGSTPVLIITETFARQYFPNEDPIGKRIKPGIYTHEGDEKGMREVVGVVGDIRNQTLSREARAAYYFPHAQIPFTQMAVVVKTAGEPHSLISGVTKEVAAMDADLPVFAAKSMEDYLSTSVAAPRFNTTLLSIFAAVALALTVVGLYGVMSYSVAQRTNEIGIRLALGAQSRDVLLMIVKQGSALIGLGLVIGLLGAYALTRLMASLLFGVTAKDPFTFAAVAVLLALVALLACYIPAWRATKVDPMEALRCE